MKETCIRFNEPTEGVFEAYLVGSFRRAVSRSKWEAMGLLLGWLMEEHEHVEVIKYEDGVITVRTT